MKTITVNRFDGGMTENIYQGNADEFSVSKHFDILTYPYRLYPLRGMVADTASTGIGNLIIASNGSFYGLGNDVSGTPSNGSLWVRGSGWTQLTHTSADPVSFNFLVEYHKSDGTRQIFYATTVNTIKALDLADTAIVSHALTFTNIAQGFVHPKDDVLYVPYDNKIAKNDNGAWTDAALTLPANKRITSITNYGDFLAIATIPSVGGVDYGGGSGNNSIVYLWDRNSSLTTLSQSIDWGAGNLKAINNLDGILIGITDTGGSSANILDYDSIQIKFYRGSVPELFKEILTVKQTTTVPDAVINPRVNFTYRGRMYFSVDILSGSTSPAYHGLWSIGKSKLSNQYAVTIERIATTDNSETTVIAAAISGDKTIMVYNAEGTLSVSNTTAGTGAQYTATSIYESCVNPGMEGRLYHLDKIKQKALATFAVHTVPLPSGAQVVAKYRVDGGAWTTIFTMTSGVTKESTFDAAGLQFKNGRDYEFRLESTGFAQILDFAYKYETLETNI